MRKQFGKALALLDAKILKPIAGAAEKRQAAYGESIEDPRSIIRQGLIVIFLFFGCLGAWSILGHISGAVVASGKIKVETERKTVQHLEGGIVDSILVREGDDVEAGQTLIVLLSVEVDANASMLQKQLVAQLAAQARYSVEKDMENDLQWSEELLEMARNTKSTDVLENEKKIFLTHRDTLNGQISLIKAQLAQLAAQVAGYEDQVKAEKVIIGTLNEELHAKRQLYKERYLEKSQILELEREHAAHQGTLGRLKQSIAEARQRAAELNLRIQDAKTRFIEEATRSLGNIDNEIIQTRERIRPLKDARERLQIVAPVSGKVVDLKVHSKGGVVRAGEPLMDIVPHDNPLVVETHVPVNNITDVYTNQEANVQLDAFDARNTPHIPGKVTYVSADRLEENGEVFFLCYVEIDPKGLKEADLYISPGMPATVFLMTEEKTILYYILQPLIKSWDRALRE